jgi:hypothetical protein
VSLWIEDADAKPGGTIEARVRNDAGERTGIRGVIVEGAGDKQTFYGLP